MGSKLKITNHLNLKTAWWHRASWKFYFLFKKPFYLLNTFKKRKSKQINKFLIGYILRGFSWTLKCTFSYSPVFSFARYCEMRTFSLLWISFKKLIYDAIALALLLSDHPESLTSMKSTVERGLDPWTQQEI